MSGVYCGMINYYMKPSSHSDLLTAVAQTMFNDAMLACRNCSSYSW